MQQLSMFAKSALFLTQLRVVKCTWASAGTFKKHSLWY